MNTTGPELDAEPEQEPSLARRRPGRLVALLAGLVSAAVALGVAELVSGFNRQWRSPVLDVGDRVIDAAPPFLKEFAIDTFGTNDKPALLIGIGVILAIYAAIVGYVALRHRFIVGVVGIALFGLVGVWAALSRRSEAPWHVVVPSLFGAAAGIGALLLLRRSLCTAPAAAADLDESDTSTGRRTFLAHSGVVLGGLAASAAVVGAVGRWLGNRFSASESRSGVALPAAADPLPELPAGVQVDVAGMTPFVTPNADFYRIDTALTAPQVPIEGYLLRFTGMVDNQLELSYEDLLDRELIERDITLTCVSNEIGGRLIGNARWLGTRLDALLEEAGVQPGADQIVGRSFDGYPCGFPVADAMDGRDALVVVGMNGEPLPIEHGFPVRLVVPGLYGYVSATKWLTEIELTTFAAFDHYWLRRGWAQKAPIKLMSRIDTPKGLANVAAGVVPIAGVAWEQHVGISAVEVNVDDAGWQPAELGEVTSDDTWRQWKYSWEATPGRHSIAVRAIDNTGAIQTDERAEPIPDGASGHHTIVVNVG
ncbi:MAG: molybdopterin-dependent oxidoreductase [Ilumatobacteraceae bacterium]